MSFIVGLFVGTGLGMIIMGIMSISGIESERERKECFEMWNELDKKYK